MSQVTATTFQAKHIKLLNGIVKRTRADEDRGIRQQQLKNRRLRIVVFTDSSFANNDDISTQLGFVIDLTDNPNLANILHYAS